jgi:hypothetical protein
LVLWLLQDEQVKIVLDMGFGEEEQSRNEKILNRAEASGISIERTDFFYWIRSMPAQDL